MTNGAYQSFYVKNLLFDFFGFLFFFGVVCLFLLIFFCFSQFFIHKKFPKNSIFETLKSFFQ